MFNLNIKSDIPIYEQIIDNIKELVLKNKLKTDDKLPSVREMASILSVSPNTVSKAYKELERQKIIHTVRGRGTFVSDSSNTPIDDDRLEKAIENLKIVCIELVHLGYNKEKIFNEINKIHYEIQKEV